MNTHRRWMLRRIGAPMLAAVCLTAAPAWAELPRQNLWVELRWVDQALSGAAAAGVRDGSVVVSTGGSVSPRGGVTLSTERRSQREQSLPRLMVLNGQQASVTLNEVTPLQWVDIGLDRQQGRQDRYYVAPRQGVAERSRGVTVKPSWSGGRSPVTVEIRTQEQTVRPSGAVDPSGQPPSEDASVLSTVQVPLGQWVTIARSGSYYAGSSANQYSTRDAEVQRMKELQVRVDLAP
ncbi:hypothetical protein OU995_02885 [Roseateles sp. SL47]|uniref:hypothetical protein n=1 Tax=Roseateles sp. SL47 TaxID=2995138 RepID=UPI00226F22C3|nr:hypothetical protein [Roseateles sp. SL47]WAC73705.1 hypothetical protein OU995_02885 [Roseateles sp. SL47]